MKDQETVQKFIELCAQGWSFVRIIAELSVAKSTLTEWSRKFRFKIHNRRALVLDDLQDRVLGTVQSRVTGLAEKLSRVESELRQRGLAEVSTPQLMPWRHHFAARSNARPAQSGLLPPPNPSRARNMWTRSRNGSLKLNRSLNRCCTRFATRMLDDARAVPTTLRWRAAPLINYCDCAVVWPNKIRPFRPVADLGP